MAAPGLGYVKRDVEKTTVDWGAISGGLTTALGGAFAAGEKQKAETALTDQTMAGEIQKLPKGVTPDQSKYFSSAIQNIGDANQKIKEQYDNGDISATQYKIAVNSLNTQYQIFKNNATTYQKSYEDFIKKVTDGKSGATTQLVATWVDQMGGMNKSVEWNPETQVLESSYVTNGQVIKSPVSNDLSLMNYYNTAFDNDLIVKGKQRFGQMVSSTEGIEGDLTYSKGYRKNKAFQNSLTDYARASVAADKTGIDAAEYLAAEKGYKLVSGVPQNENEIQVINNKNGIPEVVDIEKYQKLAVDGFKESILVSLDNTYKQKEGAAQYETDFTTNKNIVMGLVGKVNSVNEYVDHLDQFKADTYTSRDELAKSSQTFTVKSADGMDEEISAAEYVASRPEATFFEKDEKGQPKPVVLNTFEDFFSYANEAAGLSPEKISAFKKREKGKKYFIENGEIKFDTPATIAEKRRQGISLPKYIEGNIISQTTTATTTPSINAPTSSAAGLIIDQSLGQTIGTSDASAQKQQEEIRKLQLQALSEQEASKGSTSQVQKPSINYRNKYNY